MSELAFFKFVTRHLLLAVAVAIALTDITAFSQTIAAQEIIRQAVVVNRRDWESIPDLDYYVSKPDGERTKTYESSMLSGSRYARLVAIDGQPLSPEDEAKEKRKFEATMLERQQEDTSEREKRIGKYHKEIEQYDLLASETIKALDFTLEGREMLGIHEAYVLKGKPRSEYDPPNNQAKVLTGVQGTVWISTAEFHLLKFVAEVVSPVRIEGFVAQIEPGTRIELEQAPIATGLWMPSHFRMYAEARVLLLFPHYTQDENTYFDYHKSIVDTADANVVK